MAKEATKSFVLRVDAATMEAVEVGCGRVPQHQRTTAVDHHGSSAQKRPPEKITGRETGAETRKRVNLCESVLCGGVPAATAGSLGSGENGSK